MFIAEIENIKKENKEWNQIIDYISQECILMKNRLSTLLEEFNASFIVEWFENFQNRIIMKEQVLWLLKNDLKEQQFLIEKSYYENSNEYVNMILEKHENIRMQIQFLEKGCLEMKQSFNDFISLHLLV